MRDGVQRDGELRAVVEVCDADDVPGSTGRTASAVGTYQGELLR